MRFVGFFFFTLKAFYLFVPALGKPASQEAFRTAAGATCVLGGLLVGLSEPSLWAQSPQGCTWGSSTSPGRPGAPGTPCSSAAWATSEQQVFSSQLLWVWVAACPPSPQRPYWEALPSCRLGRELVAGCHGQGRWVGQHGWCVRLGVVVSVWGPAGAVTPNGGLAVVI